MSPIRRAPLTALVLLAMLATSLPAPPADAGVVERACRTSDRGARDAATCSCIDRLARQELTRSQRRKVARFFDDPHRAQEVRQSDRASDRAFWERYKAFGARVEQACN